jgi:DNA-binding response OmpR family regulator
MILTSDPSTRHQVEASTLGIHAFARKPLQFAELAEALRGLNMSLVLTGAPADLVRLPS